MLTEKLTTFGIRSLLCVKYRHAVLVCYCHLAVPISVATGISADLLARLELYRPVLSTCSTYLF